MKRTIDNGREMTYHFPAGYTIRPRQKIRVRLENTGKIRNTSRSMPVDRAQPDRTRWYSRQKVPGEWGPTSPPLSITHPAKRNQSTHSGLYSPMLNPLLSLPTSFRTITASSENHIQMAIYKVFYSFVYPS